MNNIKRYEEFINEEFQLKDISNFSKIIKLRSDLKTLDWDDHIQVRKIFNNIYPSDKLDKKLRDISNDDMIDILYKISKLNHIPELYYDKNHKKIMIK